MLTKSRAAEMIEAIKRVQLLVVGDLMLDRYVFGAVTRISPEAPVPVVHVDREETRPGGASNVALCAEALGAKCILSGVLGDDPAGRDLLAALKNAGVNVEGVYASDRVKTTVKTRVLADRQQVVRVDREEPPSCFQDCVQGLRDRLASLVSSVDAVIVEDYGKGIVCQTLMDVVLDAAKATHRLVGFDPKDNHLLSTPWLTLATPNYREACMAAGIKETPLPKDPLASSTLREVGLRLSERWGTEFLLITLGAHGMYVLPRQGEPRVLPTLAREVFDVSGAGDTVIATTMSALATGATIDEAAMLANHAAGVVVGKLGTAVCKPHELLASFDATGGGNV